ncbi:LacI family transcriptional regulator [Ktedonobacter sp. SOSP1-52]|uniref:LacI family DNA-binding transcriptional regulator n=1 Tax=Ktedonobacter sp. SOSP1-52 TaxID=2778366 RepID=UPI001915E21C|nr:LacI family DNA-binding transcriptional regulator [Ktedonobacter sp. SOSP1-52]GHO62839.1 LacI family transcriptional regulator [Ktedonobacter sp. SOSP1-52]
MRNKPLSVTIKDVAQLAGVSSATVSRVLAHQPHVTEKVRQHVLNAVNELHYQPNRVARSLRLQRANILGLVVADVQNPFFLAIVRAVEDIAIAHGYAVFLCNADEQVEKAKMYIDLMLAENVAGVIIAPSRAENDPCLACIEAGIPVVLIDRTLEDAQTDTVIVDNCQSAFRLVSHLIDDGYTRIGAIFGDLQVSTNRERRTGYEQALLTHNLPCAAELVRQGKPIQEVGYQLTCELLGLPEPPQALFCGNNLLTKGALQALHDRHLRIPDDIAVGAFDESDWTSLMQPALTVIAQPAYEIGTTATEFLLQRIRGDERPPREVVLNTAFHIRGSCAHHR